MDALPWVAFSTPYRAKSCNSVSNIWLPLLSRRFLTAARGHAYQALVLQLNGMGHLPSYRRFWVRVERHHTIKKPMPEVVWAFSAWGVLHAADEKSKN